MHCAEVHPPDAVIPSKNVHFATIHKRRVASTSCGHIAIGISEVPGSGLRVKVHQTITVCVLLRMVRTIGITSTAEDVHSCADRARRVEVPVRGPVALDVDFLPNKRIQVERVGIVRENIGVFFETAEDVHVLADHTR